MQEQQEVGKQGRDHHIKQLSIQPLYGDLFPYYAHNEKEM